MSQIRTWAPLALAAALLAACGGGGSDTTPRTQITSVKVMGDSLADSGTFGYKFTVKTADVQIYPERIAASYGVAALCPAFVATSATTFVRNPTPGCTNYAIGGGRINTLASDPTETSPVSIVAQLKVAGAENTYTATDLLIIDGGGNDAADLVRAYLGAGQGQPTPYLTLLSTLLPPATVQAAAAQGAAGFAQIGGTYMTALADKYADAIKTNALDKGATHVAVLNMPGITNTPQFQAALDQIAAASGGGTAGATARAQAEGLFNSWFVAFNTQLAAKFAGNANVALIDFYTSFNDEIAAPGQYSLTNVKVPACGATAFPACTDTLLSAQTPPADSDGTPNWWKSYAFADSFHPTPYGHDLLARYITRGLAQAGWF